MTDKEINKENKEIKEIITKKIIVMQGWANGREVAYRHKGTDVWIKVIIPSWDWLHCDYKIIGREFWVNVYRRVTCVYNSKLKADTESTEDRLRCIHVKEVL